jgi:hypothetical protein
MLELILSMVTYCCEVPKVMVYANVHIAPDRFGMNDINEAIWEEDGKDTPGVWDGKWQVDNARKIKFLSGEKQLWQPLMYENDIYHCGHRELCVPPRPSRSFPSPRPTRSARPPRATSRVVSSPR